MERVGIRLGCSSTLSTFIQLLCYSLSLLGNTVHFCEVCCPQIPQRLLLGAAVCSICCRRTRTSEIYKITLLRMPLIMSATRHSPVAEILRRKPLSVSVAASPLGPVVPPLPFTTDDPIRNAISRL